MQQAPLSVLHTGSRRSLDTHEALVCVFCQIIDCIAGDVFTSTAALASSRSQSQG